MEFEEIKNVIQGHDGVLKFRERTYVTQIGELNQCIFVENHSSCYSIHSCMNKIHRDLRLLYWCCRINKDVAKYVLKCEKCQQVNYEHQSPTHMLMRMLIPQWKSEWIFMAFVMRRPMTLGKYDFVLVILHGLTKSTSHCILDRMDYNSQQLANIYVNEIIIFRNS